jgi:hypothetical protein
MEECSITKIKVPTRITWLLGEKAGCIGSLPGNVGVYVTFDLSCC